MSAMMGMMVMGVWVDTAMTRDTTTPSTIWDIAIFLAVSRSNMSMVFIGRLPSA